MKSILLSLKLAATFIFITIAADAQVLFTEDFTADALPAGWTNDSLGQPAADLWLFGNPYTRTITGAGFDTHFVIFDSDRGSTNDNIDEYASLTTSNIDISAASNSLYLELDQQYRPLSGPNTGGSSMRIEYSTDGGSNWTTIVYDSVALGYPNPAVHSSYSLSSIIGSPNVMLRFTWTGTWDWWWAIDNISFVSYPACSGAPNPGTVSGSSSACNSVNFTLTLSGADSGPNITYQWQSSPDGNTWTDIVGAIDSTLTTSQTVATYYRCNVTCSPYTASSNSIFVDMNAPSLCYCDAVNSVACSFGEYISNVNITGTPLNNDSYCDSSNATSNYTFYPPSPTTTANLVRNTNYDINVTANFDAIISVWIDLNADGIYDASEWMQVCTTSLAGVPNTVSFAIPGTAVVGPTGMRIRSREVANPNGAGDACLTMFSGETEDYVVGIEVNVGTNEMQSIKNMAVYPNPTNGKLAVFLAENASGSTVEVFDAMGRVIKSAFVQNVLRTDFDISALTNGVYVVKVQSKGNTYTERIILNK
jgi:hypothetical protein